MWLGQKRSSLQFRIPGIKVCSRLKFLTKGLVVLEAPYPVPEVGAQAHGVDITPYPSGMADGRSPGFSSVVAF